MFILSTNGKDDINNEIKEAVSGSFSAVSYQKYEKLRTCNKRTKIIKLAVSLISLAVLMSGAVVFALAFHGRMLNRTKNETEPSVNLPIIDVHDAKSYIMSSFVGEDINEKTAEKFKIPVGVKVIAIKKEAQLFEFGLRVNDIITKINDNIILSVNDIDSFENKLDLESYECLIFTVYRNGAYRNIEIYR